MFRSKKPFILAIILWFSGVVNPGGDRLYVRISPSPNVAIKLAGQDFIKQNQSEGDLQSEAKKAEEVSKSNESKADDQKKPELPESLKKQPVVGGIEVIYSGARNFTDSAGQAEFYLSHNPKNGVNVFIAKDVFPNVLQKNTADSFSLWEKEKPATLDVQRFLLTRKKSTKEGWIWTIETKELPENGVIPNSAVVIKLDPKNIYIPLQKTTVKGKIHTILPEFFLLDREGVDKAILEDLGKKKLEENAVSTYNLFENLSEKTKVEDKTGKKVEISNLPE